MMRELIFVAATRFEFKAVYLPGKINTLPDLLSRWGEGLAIHNKFHELITGKGYVELHIPQSVFEFLHTW